jgi:hypothetical protein
MKTVNLSLLLLLACPLIAHAVNQSPEGFPVGLWHTTHYKINDAKQTVIKYPLYIEVCLQPDGTWQSINSKDGMAGRWSRERNDVHLTGNGLTYAGTGDVTLVEPYKTMSGNWQSWHIERPEGGHLSYTSRWELKNAGSCLN